MALNVAQPRRLLVVDDEPMSRELCREVLATILAADTRIDEASSGEEAVEMLHHQHYAAIIADYRMGALSGIDVLEIALHESPDTLRILMTGMGDVELAQDALARARVKGFVTKAQSIAQMGRTLEKVLSGP